MDNIVLIGMPGVGKSTLGVVLAKELGYQFVDADLLIQEREKRLLKEIIADEGVEGFLKIENDVNASISADKTVIATGGSVIYGKEAMEHLKEIGTVVYLKLDYETLDSRLGNLKGRGVVLKDGQTLMDLYNERVPLYEHYADVIVDEGGLDLESTLKKVLEGLSQEASGTFFYLSDTFLYPVFTSHFWSMILTSSPKAMCSLTEDGCFSISFTVPSPNLG